MSQKTLISIRVSKPTNEQIKRLTSLRDESQAEVVSKAIADLYEKETASIEKKITNIIIDYAASLPKQGGSLLTLTIKSNEMGEQVFTLTRDDTDNSRTYLREVSPNGGVKKINPEGD